MCVCVSAHAHFRSYGGAQPPPPPPPPLFLSLLLLLILQARRATDWTRGRSLGRDWTFLSALPPPLDVGQAEGGRSSSGRGGAPPSLPPSIPRVQISFSAFSVGIISSIVCLHWKLRGANALICVREIEASFSFWVSLWNMGSHSPGGGRTLGMEHGPFSPRPPNVQDFPASFE